MNVWMKHFPEQMTELESAVAISVIKPAVYGISDHTTKFLTVKIAVVNI